MRLCQKLGIHLISDEVYGLSVWDNPENKNPTPFKSVLSFDTENLIRPPNGARRMGHEQGE